VTGSLEGAVHAFLATVKRRDGPSFTELADETLLTEATTALATWDHGAFTDLERQLSKRAQDSSSQRGPTPAASASSKESEVQPSGVGGAGASGDERKGVKRARPAEAEEGGGAPRIDSFEGGGTAIGDAYKRSFELLKTRLLEDGSGGASGSARWLHARMERAMRVFAEMQGAAPPSASAGASAGAVTPLRVRPNARTYALLLHGALAAGQDALARDLLQSMTAAEGGVCARGELWRVMQPSFLGRLWRAGLLSAEELRALLCPAPCTQQWAFLKAAWEAGKGDQHGSKHGAVIADASWRVLSHGRNHRFGVPGDSHVRVMHSEVHALVRLEKKGVQPPHREARVLIVELDGTGVGYELATPCAMCAKALCATGTGGALFTSHVGLTSTPVHHKPELSCESLDSARLRVYPVDVTADPDAGGEDPAGFSFLEAVTRFEDLDPGRGKVFAQAKKSRK
jgi:hypothetical protein